MVHPARKPAVSEEGADINVERICLGLYLGAAYSCLVSERNHLAPLFIA